MKKMIIVLLFALSHGIGEASQDNHHAQKESSQDSHKNCFHNGQPRDEYSEENQDAIDEYDYHVCDDVKPPHISNVQLFLTNIAGQLLVHYLALQQSASVYFQDLKEWFNSVVKR